MDGKKAPTWKMSVCAWIPGEKSNIYELFKIILEETRVDPKLQNHVLVPLRMDGFHLPRGIFVGCSGLHRGRSHRWVKRKPRRQSCFFTAVNPLEVTAADFPFEEGTRRKLLCKLKWKPHHDTVHWFDFKSRAG